MKTKKLKMRFVFDDYVKANRMFSRQEELDRNGGRWIAKDRPHRNRKLYDRKRDRRIDGPFDLYKCLWFNISLGLLTNYTPDNQLLDNQRQYIFLMKMFGGLT